MNLLKVDTIDQVKEKFDKYFDTLATIEEIPLFEAEGRYLAQEIISETNIPSFSRAVVDGYAVIAADTNGASDSMPAFLQVIGEVEMGKAPEFVIESGKSAYIPTGGKLPKGANAVVMVEYTDKPDDENVCIWKSVAAGSGIMQPGEDFKANQTIYTKGHKITVKDIGMLAALGYGFVEVYRKPTVAIISTGDEIVSVFEDPADGQVRDINSYTLSALVKKSGAKVSEVRLVKDDEKSLTAATKEAIGKSDIVLISGGSSAGNKDMTAQIIDKLGKPGVFTHGIAMKPGKPTILGAVRSNTCCCGTTKLVAGLPGHPMAAIIAYLVIIEFFIKKYYFGETEEGRVSISAELTENIHAGEGRETFVLVRLRKKENATGYEAEPIKAKSGSISQLVHADGYIRLGHLLEGANVGSTVEVTLF